MHQNTYEITHRDFKLKEDETELKVVIPSRSNEHYIIGMEPAAAKVHCTSMLYLYIGILNLQQLISDTDNRD